MSDPEKRRQYDQFGSAFFENGGGGSGNFHGNPGGGRNGGFGGFSDPRDIFSQMFGGNGSFHFNSANNENFDFSSMFGDDSAYARFQKGNDLRTEVTVTFGEAFFGTVKKLRFRKTELCDVCSGSGAAPGSTVQTCRKCRGTGQVKSSSMFGMPGVCPSCGGTGKKIKQVCPKCGGSAKMEVTREIPLNIKPGVETGTKLRVAGNGEPGVNGAPHGDLIVNIRVLPHELFTRDAANNILCEAFIPLKTALLGGVVEFPSMTGKIKLKIAPGTQNGTVLRIRGKGMPSLKNGMSGDQLVKISVEIPSSLKDSQKKDFEKLCNQLDSSQQPHCAEFQRKMEKTMQ